MGTTGNPRAASSTCGSTQNPLLLSNIHHVKSHHQRRIQGDQFRHQVKAALQIYRADHGDHHGRLFADDELSGDDFLG